MSQGPVCSLPVRPFWHRLAISWIPRYIIMLTIIILYVAINIHAENQFQDSRIFRKPMVARVRSMSTAIFPHPPNTLDSRHWSMPEPSEPANQSTATEETGNGHRDCSRRPSDPDGSQDTTLAGSEATRHGSTSTGMSLVKWSHVEKPHRDANVEASHEAVTRDEGHWDHPSVESEQDSSGQAKEEPSSNKVGPLINGEMDKKRRAIRRQLRLLFIYPLLYFATWVLPFVQNILNYDDYRAKHPSFPLLLLSYASVSSMGIVDIIVFSLREKPWRHIPGTDGSVVGSFRFWQCDIQMRPRSSTLESTASSPNHTAHSAQSRRGSQHGRVSTGSLNEALGRAPPTGGHDPLAGRRGSAADGIDERLWGSTIQGLNGAGLLSGMSSWDFGDRNGGLRRQTIGKVTGDLEDPPPGPNG